MRNTDLLAWHYTTGSAFVNIAESSLLLPSTINVSPPEKPILWFSMNQFWEKTANKMWGFPDGSVQVLDMEGTRLKGRGLFRFGVRARTTIPWPLLAKKARINKEIARGLEKAGIKQGARPQEWRGSLVPILMEDCVAIEILTDDKGWLNVKPSDS